MISYDRLWETMKKKNISQYTLVNDYNFSRGQLDRLRKELNISTHTVNTLCCILNCNVEDILHYTPDPVEEQPTVDIIEHIEIEEEE